MPHLRDLSGPHSRLSLQPRLQQNSHPGLCSPLWPRVLGGSSRGPGWRSSGLIPAAKCPLGSRCGDSSEEKVGSLVLVDSLSPPWLPSLPVSFLRALRCPFELVAGACRESGGLGGPRIHGFLILKTRNQTHSKASNSVPSFPVVVHSHFPLFQDLGRTVES